MAATATLSPIPNVNHHLDLALANAEQEFNQQQQQQQDALSSPTLSEGLISPTAGLSQDDFSRLFASQRSFSLDFFDTTTTTITTPTNELTLELIETPPSSSTEPSTSSLASPFGGLATASSTTPRITRTSISTPTPTVTPLMNFNNSSDLSRGQHPGQISTSFAHKINDPFSPLPKKAAVTILHQNEEQKKLQQDYQGLYLRSPSRSPSPSSSSLESGSNSPSPVYEDMPVPVTACASCKRSHIKCDHGRPCQNCMKHPSKAATCRDAVPKPRGRPKGGSKIAAEAMAKGRHHHHHHGHGSRQMSHPFNAFPPHHYSYLSHGPQSASPTSSHPYQHPQQQQFSRQRSLSFPHVMPSQQQVPYAVRQQQIQIQQRQRIAQQQQQQQLQLQQQMHLEQQQQQCQKLHQQHMFQQQQQQQQQRQFLSQPQIVPQPGLYPSPMPMGNSLITRRGTIHGSTSEYLSPVAGSTGPMQNLNQQLQSGMPMPMPSLLFPSFQSPSFATSSPLLQQEQPHQQQMMMPIHPLEQQRFQHQHPQFMRPPYGPTNLTRSHSEQGLVNALNMSPLSPTASVPSSSSMATSTILPFNVVRAGPHRVGPLVSPVQQQFLYQEVLQDSQQLIHGTSNPVMSTTSSTASMSLTSGSTAASTCSSASPASSFSPTPGSEISACSPSLPTPSTFYMP
ncbi:hypothetical protein BGZ83_005762 [Gryganskiella cystojenkinii]|nr:hypothetical protein BGZ83_005762 [Gryganskiella cystojenkinii]